MKKLKYCFLLIFFLLAAFHFHGCKKPSLSGELTFSNAQITFDTVFTTLGSTTRNFTVHNNSNKDIKVTVYLKNGLQSYFNMNVDGVAGNYQKDVIVPAKDSIFVFVKVTINPGNQNTPFLVTDAIIFRTKEKEQSVELMAYGQDANFIVANAGSGDLQHKIVAGAHETVTWTNEKPYVVFGWAAIDSLGTLIIEPGAKIYFHRSSGIWVYRFGNIKVNGTIEDPVLFRGDRLESGYSPDFVGWNADYAQWNRIWILEGDKDNIINHAIISNAFVGIQAETMETNTNNKTIITNTIIKNSKNSGVIARFYNIDMTNCVVTNNGSCGLQFEVGEFNIKHVTVANYFSQSKRENPAVYITNIYSPVQSYHTKATFINSIIYGALDNELLLRKDNGYQFDITFENCLLKTAGQSANFVQCLFNLDPEFKEQTKLDFGLQNGSPAIGKGKSGIDVPTDILGNTRKTPPDMGAYEYAP